MTYRTEWDFNSYTPTLKIHNDRFYRYATQRIIQRKTDSGTYVVRFATDEEFNAAWELLEITAAVHRIIRRHAGTTVYPLCVRLYNGEDIDVPTLTEQEYFILTTAKQEEQSRMLFLKQSERLI